MESKTCTKCKTTKPIIEFHRQQKGKYGVTSKCKVCTHILNKQWTAQNKERDSKNKRASRLKIRYGLTLDDYENMLKEQNYTCAICKQPETNIRLAVDHCHKTGVIRGLLCKRCNQMLGNMEDNTEWLSNTINYLNKR